VVTHQEVAEPVGSGLAQDFQLALEQLIQLPLVLVALEALVVALTMERKVETLYLAL
jgi:hypothetical protein